MHIKKLTLTNYRSAGNLSLDLHERLNVMVGMNGAGKSSILDATAILLSWAVSRIKHGGASGRPINDSDIKNGQFFAMLEIECNYNSSAVEWKIVRVRTGRKKDIKSVLHGVNELSKQIQILVEEQSGRANIPVFAYYPVNRAVLDIPLRIREKHSFDLFSAYDESLSRGANFRTFFEWFREREDLENENRKYKDQLIKPDDFLFPDPQLEAVRQALGKVLPEFANLAVRRNPLRMEVEKCGKRLTVNQLSDGEKCLMALVGDLARRMAIANPSLSNPLDGDGIILIDEIDLHLHPKWQRMVIPKLVEVFPNCQFIISTHSPHIITHVRPENLFLLKQTDSGIEAEQPRESYGKNVDRILEDLMGLTTTRPDAVEADLKEVFQTINTGNLKNARKQIAELKIDIGDDPDLVKAEVLIKRKEIIGK